MWTTCSRWLLIWLAFSGVSISDCIPLTGHNGQTDGLVNGTATALNRFKRQFGFGCCCCCCACFPVCCCCCGKRKRRSLGILERKHMQKLRNDLQLIPSTAT
ncbi:hypothetical protein Tcan_00760, partial [Toxocara canis]